MKVVTYISNNQLTGNISSIVGDLQALEYLSLKNNSLEGLIPDSFGNLPSTQSLDLSMNNLSREIPKPLEKLLRLRFLKLSYNNLYGKIPIRGPFVNFSSQSLTENGVLCGASRLQIPPCKMDQEKLMRWFGGVGTCGLLVRKEVK